MVKIASFHYDNLYTDFPYFTLPNQGYYDNSKGNVLWKIASAGALVPSASNSAPSVTLLFNPSFDSDSSPYTEANVNKGSNLGSSVNYFQILSINSPVREIGNSGGPLFVDRSTRDVLNNIYRRQLTQDGYCLIYPRTPYTGHDGGPGQSPYVRVFMHPLKFVRTMFGAGDIFQMSATFTYLEIPNYL